MAQTTIGTITTEEGVLTFVQFCDECHQRPEKIKKLVEEGILEPSGQNEQDWRFEFDLKFRALKAMRLQRDFEMNLAGVALAMHLLDRIEKLEKLMDINQKD